MAILCLHVLGFVVGISNWVIAWVINFLYWSMSCWSKITHSQARIFLFLGCVHQHDRLHSRQCIIVIPTCQSAECGCCRLACLQVWFLRRPQPMKQIVPLLGLECHSPIEKKFVPRFYISAPFGAWFERLQSHHWFTCHTLQTGTLMGSFWCLYSLLSLGGLIIQCKIVQLSLCVNHCMSRVWMWRDLYRLICDCFIFYVFL